MPLLDQLAVADDVDGRVRVHKADDAEVYFLRAVYLDNVLAPHFLTGGVFDYSDGAVQIAQAQQAVELHGAAGADVVYDEAVFDGVNVHVTPPAA